MKESTYLSLHIQGTASFPLDMCAKHRQLRKRNYIHTFRLSRAYHLVFLSKHRLTTPKPAKNMLESDFVGDDKESD